MAKKSEKPKKIDKNSGLMVRTSVAYPYEIKNGKLKKIPTIDKMTPIEKLPKKLRKNLPDM
jgi:hypothetical protein